MTMLVKFYKMYEPGEFQAPILEKEEIKEMLMDFLPNYKDTFIYKNKKYFVHDVIHEYTNIDSLFEGVDITIKVYRKVELNEIDMSKTR